MTPAGKPGYVKPSPSLAEWRASIAARESRFYGHGVPEASGRDLAQLVDAWDEDREGQTQAMQQSVGDALREL